MTGLAGRQLPTVQGSVAAAAAAALITVGAFAIAVNWFADGDSAAPGVLTGLVLVACGYGVMNWLGGVVRPAGVSLVLLGIPIMVGFGLNGQLNQAWQVLLLLALLWGIAYVAPISHGELSFLIGSLGATWALIVNRVAALADDDGVSSITPSFPTPGENDAAAYVSLAVGVVLLLAAYWLDRTGWAGTATGFISVGNLAFVIGVAGVLASFDGVVAPSLVVVVAGFAMTIVGAGSGRRFTAWLGAVGMAVGLIALIVDLFNPTTENPGGFGIAAIGVGVVIVGAVARLHAVRGERLPH